MRDNISKMNLFFLSRNPREAARAHCNRHVVKMVLETAQLLSTAHRVADGRLACGTSKSGRKASVRVLSDAGREGLLYRATHANHPVAAWIRKSSRHYAWAYRLFQELLCEYQFRYGKVHACSKLLAALAAPPTAVRDAGFDEPPKCMPEKFHAAGDAVACYREYYREDKHHLLQYKARDRPAWL
jgi:hypothetical protein